MVESWDDYSEDQWDAGFEGDRFVVVSRLGPFKRVFPKPAEFRRRFWRQLYELPLREWKIALEPLRFGQLCAVEAELAIRYQPTLAYARAHLDFLDDLPARVESGLGALIKDAAEQEIRRMEEATEWLRDGCRATEKAVANLVNELLVMRGIQCRARCVISPQFAPVDAVDLDALPPWFRHQAIYEEYLRRRREARERILREQTEEAASARRLLMEREATLLALARQEEEQRESRRSQEMEGLKAALAAEEALLAERRASETRKRDEQIQHEDQLRQKQAESRLREKQVELEMLRAETEADKTLQDEKLESELDLHQERLRHQAWLRTLQEEAETKTRLAELEHRRALEETRLAKEQEIEVRLREDQLRHEARLRRLQAEADLTAKEMELAQRRAEMAKVESQLEEQRECEARQREEQLRHEARLRDMQTEQELREKELRGPAIAELENYLNREIELLATERQRLVLEEEIRQAKQSKTRGLIVNALGRLGLEQEATASAQESQDST